MNEKQSTPAKRKASKGGAPKGNVNAFVHGLRGGLQMTNLPDGCRRIQSAVRAFRRHLEAAVIEDRGEVNITDAAAIHTATRAEQHAQLASRWLREGFDTMSTNDRLACSREVVRASEARDKAIDRLKLPASVRSGQDALAAMYEGIPQGADNEGDGEPHEPQGGGQ